MEVTPAVAPVVETAPAPAADGAGAPAAEPATPVAAAPAPEAPAPISFDNIEDARLHLLANARDKVVRAVDSVRFQGKLIEKLPPGEIRRAVEGHVERQRRFPLDTANALRGRLRREGFTIFKKGSRGVSYVCAVKRRFRVPGQVFSETITTLIDFIEKNPMVHIKDLPKAFLAIEVPAAPPAAPVPEGTTPSQAPFVALAPEQAEKLRKMSNDLRWLVMEGYVTEFSDGKLFAPPPMAPQAAERRPSPARTSTTRWTSPTLRPRQWPRRRHLLRPKRLRRNPPRCPKPPLLPRKPSPSPTPDLSKPVQVSGLFYG